MPNAQYKSNQTQRTKGTPKKLRTHILNRDNHTCQLQYPGCTHTATQVDHTTPVCQGGTTTPTNLQAVCPQCHTTKTLNEAKQQRQKYGRKRPQTTPHPGLIQ